MIRETDRLIELSDQKVFKPEHVFSDLIPTYLDYSTIFHLIGGGKAYRRRIMILVQPYRVLL